MSEYKNVPFVPCNDCANFESCTNDFVAELLEPYDVESTEDLIANVRNKTIDEIINMLESIHTENISKWALIAKLEQLRGGTDNGEE